MRFDFLSAPTVIVNEKPTFLIIGAGVVGLSLAWELSRRGHSVSIIESPADQHRSASWAGAGILPPAGTKNIDDPHDRLRMLSHQLHPVWAVELRQATGIDTGFRRCGGIYLASSRAEVATLTANQFWWDEHGIEYQNLNLAELAELEPNLTEMARRGSVRAWRLPEECQLRNPHHLQALRQACTQNNVRIIRATIDRLEIGVSGTAMVIGGDRTFWADKICLCTGAWTRLLMDQVQLSSGIMPIRGQMLLYKCATSPLTHIINEGSRYLVPRDDGYLLAGSVEEEAGYRCETTVESLAIIQQWAEATLPLLKKTAIVKSWAGLRPGSYDGFPYLGLAPGTDNLYVAAGHFRSGLHLSCGTAVLMAELMLGQPTAMDLAAFRVGRG